MRTKEEFQIKQAIEALEKDENLEQFKDNPFVAKYLRDITEIESLSKDHDNYKDWLIMSLKTRLYHDQYYGCRGNTPDPY